MAIVKMKKISIIALSYDKERVLDILEKTGVMEIDDYTGDDLKKENSSIADIEAKIRVSEKAQREINKYIDKKANSSKDFDSKNLAENILTTLSKRQKIIDEIAKAKLEIERLKPYKALDVSAKNTDIKTVNFKMGYFKSDIDLKAIFKYIPLSHYEVLKKDSIRTYVWIMFFGNINSNLIDAGFIEEKLNFNTTVDEQINLLNEKINELIKKDEALLNLLTKYAKSSNDLSVIPLLREKERIETENKIGHSAKTIYLNGYIPAKSEGKMKKLLTGVYVEFSEPDENAPIAFSNNAFVAPVEGITSSYSMPSKTDIDPNPIMALFYYIFFGMMFSDAGYGLLMIIVCGYMGFFKKTKMSQMMRMFFFCGLSTTFWGLMYGSFFGNAITSISETFFGNKITLSPLWIDPTAEPLKLLIFSISLGFFQIIIGLLIKFYTVIRQGKVFEAICDTGSWIVLLLGICVFAIGMYVPNASNIGKIMMIIGAIMLILTQGRDKKNIFAKLFGGIISLYDITSYVSDVLSYSRLMALGLATGVIAQVINILGSLGGKSIVGFIMFVLVFIIGHSMNFAINMLGAYVHTNRLQYVEFFSKFYEGGGRRFEPFGKYYQTEKN